MYVIILVIMLLLLLLLLLSIVLLLLIYIYIYIYICTHTYTCDSCARVRLYVMFRAVRGGTPVQGGTAEQILAKVAQVRAEFQAPAPWLVASRLVHAPVRSRASLSRDRAPGLPGAMRRPPAAGLEAPAGRLHQGRARGRQAAGRDGTAAGGDGTSVHVRTHMER